MTRQRAPVEPLSRAAWNRVEAGLFARLERGEHLNQRVDAAGEHAPLPGWLGSSWVGRRWLGRSRVGNGWAGRGVAGAMVFAAAAAFALWWSTASVRQAPSDPMTLAGSAAAELAKHETRIVTTEAPTETTLGDAHVTLAAHSDVTVSGSERDGWRVRLDAGAVDCAVAPRLGRPPFVVQGGEILVTVVGTRFSVTRDGARSRVDVREGHVRVDAADVHALLAPGESWPAVASGRDVAPSSGARAAASNLGAPGGAPTGAATRLDAATEHGAGTPGAAARAGLGADSIPARATPERARPESAQQRFERAARLEARAPRAALAIYERLSRGRGPWAQNALYARARLELEGGNLQRAESLLRRYEQRYPQGLNARDVEALLTRIEQTRPAASP
jgi:ferric-dicitrate binding protein FerR (iron transport regulator)